MRKLLIMMIATFIVFGGNLTLAQTETVNEEDFFDEESDVDAGQADVPPNEIGAEDSAATPPPNAPGDFADPPPNDGQPPTNNSRRSRFRGGSDNSAPSDTSSPVYNRPVTPVKEIKVVEKASRNKKMTFAEAHPEDITNENFPDLIKSFDYPDAEILDVAKAIGKLTGKNFIIEPGVRGKITIVAPTQITVAEAWEAFLSSLAMNGFTIVPAGKFLKIRKLQSAMNDSIETYTGAYFPTVDQLVTRIIRLKYIGAEDVKKSLGNLVKTGVDIFPYEKTNSLIITGFGSSIERITRIIDELDKPGFEERLEVVPIKNAKAKEIKELIEKIIDKGEDKSNNRFRSSRFNQTDEKKNESVSLVAEDERTNSIVIVGNQEGVKRIKTLIARLDYPLDPADAGGVYVYYVKHGEAKKIAETLSGIAQETEKATESQNKKASGKEGDADFEPPKKTRPLFGGSVVIKDDENTNSLVITANKQDYRTVANLLAKIDIPKDQVFVEAIIMEMEATSSALWNFNIVKYFGSDNQAAGQDGLARAGIITGNLGEFLNPVGGKGAVLGIGDPNDRVSIQGPTGTIEIPSLIALINFLKEKTNANILSTPHLTAMDNEESTIEVGDEVPVGGAQNFGVGGANLTTITPQFKDATIELKVKPFISPDSDVVRLNVEQKIQKVSTQPIQAAALAQTTQALTKKIIKTNIVLNNRQTAVLGGLMEDQDEVVETKIPLLGDIPVLGWLFKSRDVDRKKKNLVVFLTPTIIRSSSDHTSILKEKLNQRVDWIKKNNKGVDPYGERFNKMIKTEANASTINDIDAQNELEIDVEGATPVDDLTAPVGGENPETPLAPVGNEELELQDSSPNDQGENLFE